MNDLIDVGLNCFVRADEIAFIHDGYAEGITLDSHIFNRSQGNQITPAAVITLQNGKQMPSYINAKELRARINRIQTINANELRADATYSARLADRITDDLADIRQQLTYLRARIKSTTELLPAPPTDEAAA